MKTIYTKIRNVVVLIVMGISLEGYSQQLYHLGSYYSGDGLSAAEIVDYDSENKTLYMINGAKETVDVLDATNPANLIKLRSLDVSAYGAPTSVAVNGGLIAVAVPNNDKSKKGKVVCFNSNGTQIGAVEVGYLPDMVTFNNDGSKILTANEGEPTDDYSFDGEGSVSIISRDLSKVDSVFFRQYDGKENHLRNKGVRIFGNNGQASASQDLEPEYITIQGNLAYVSLQENNAIAVIDIAQAEVLDILPLGYKDHLLGKATSENYDLINSVTTDWPTLGVKHSDGGTVKLGGFSGLYYDENESSTTELVFYAIPDRGPNDGTFAKSTVVGITKPNPTQNLRPFLLPDYQARIVKFTVNTTSGKVTLNEEDQIFLTQADGTTPISGKGNVEGTDEVPVAYYKEGSNYTSKDYYTLDGDDSTFFHALDYDAFGGDFEGILKDKDGNFWLCDEYRPAIYKFNATGQLINRFVPEGPYENVGDETLPAVYNKRWANRGFEGIAYNADSGLIYAFIQSPMQNPNGTIGGNGSDIIRILAIDTANGMPKHEYVYLLNRNEVAGITGKIDKIGDATYVGDGKFWVIERDSDFNGMNGHKMVYEIDLRGATDVLNMPISSLTDENSLESKTADQLMELGIQPVFKRGMVNLPSVGYTPGDKAEGIVKLADGVMAVINDNDFGKEGANSGGVDDIWLGIITFDNSNAFDASDKDKEVGNLNNWRTLGMYMPDGIASYNVDGVNYIVTANEGDSRDYDGYSEEERVGDLDWNTQYYGEEVESNDALKRLKTTTANGDIDGDGVYDYIYSYGARSFSIFDEKGNQTFDSHNEMALEILAGPHADWLNASYDTDPDTADGDEWEWSADNRSDDKGTEPENVAIGEYNGVTYAFVCLERMNGVMVYDISNPFDASFVQFISTAKYGKGESATTSDSLSSGKAGDIAPEGIHFVSAEKSKAGYPLLFVAHEGSGSVAVFGLSVDPVLGANDDVVSVLANQFYAFPTSASSSIRFSKTTSGQVLNISGLVVMEFEAVNVLSVANLKQGAYIVKTIEGQTSRFNKF